MGTGFDALAQAGVQNAEFQSERKRQLSDEERETALADHNNTIRNLQQRMSQVGANDPSYGTLQTQLNQVVSDRTALFHPNNGPGAMAHLGKMLWQHVHGKPQDAPRVAETPIQGSQGSTLPGMAGGAPIVTPTLPAATSPSDTKPNTPVTPAGMKARVAQDLSYGAPAPPQNPTLIYRKQLQEALPHLSPEELDKAVAIHAGFEPKPVDRPETWTTYGKPVKNAEGVWVQPFKNREGQIENRATPAGYEPPLPSAHMTNQAQLRADYAKALGKKPEDLTFEDDQNMVSAVKRAGTAVTVGTHVSFVPQANGDIKAVTTTTTSSKQFPGAGSAVPPGSSKPSPAAPTGNEPTAPTPGGLKKRAAGVAEKTKAGVVNNGNIVGHRNTPPETKAKTAVDAAQSSYLDVQKASQDPTSLGDKGILLAWLRGRVNRVTQSEIASVSNLGGAQLVLENGIARITKGQMSPTQRQWFLQSAKQNYDIAQQVAAKYEGGQGGGEDGGSDMVMATIPGVGTQPIHRSQVQAFKAKYPNGTVDENAH